MLSWRQSWAELVPWNFLVSMRSWWMYFWHNEPPLYFKLFRGGSDPCNF